LVQGQNDFRRQHCGCQAASPIRELDVWIPVPKLAEITSISEAVIRDALKKEFAATESGATDCLIRLKSPEAAMKLVFLIRGWIAPQELQAAP
jgi:hypothetical protein